MDTDSIKILLVDAALDGHHLNYINGLAQINNCKLIGGFPNYSDIEFSPNIEKIIPLDFVIRRDGFHGYLKWIKEIKMIIERENPDLVHFLDGDSIMKYFGLYMNSLKKPIIITYHHFFKGFIRSLSYKCMCWNKYPVVHTKHIEGEMSNLKIKNITHIEYPVFSYNNLIGKDVVEAKRSLGISEKEIVLGMIGTINKYKGYNVLFEALKHIDKKYHILIAGQPISYTDKELKKMANETGMDSTIITTLLTENQYNTMIAASDIIILPYTKDFNGASGPLADGVCCKKMIICSNHGSLGELVKSNHIGYCFKTDDYNDLAKLLNKIDVKKFTYDNMANQYREILKPQVFSNEYFLLYRKVLGIE